MPALGLHANELLINIIFANTMPDEFEMSKVKI
jgi:hypothetical protein